MSALSLVHLVANDGLSAFYRPKEVVDYNGHTHQ